MRLKNMRERWILLSITILLCSSCAHSDGIVREETVRFKIVAEDVEDLRVTNMYSKRELESTADGIYIFDTPVLRTYRNVFFFIPYESRSEKDVELIEVREKGGQVIKVNLHEFRSLPRDGAGTCILEIK